MTRYYYMVATSYNGCASIVGTLQRVKEMHPDAITSTMLSEEKKKKNEEN